MPKRTIVLLLSALVLTAGCGLKGDLYLPTTADSESGGTGSESGATGQTTTGDHTNGGGSRADTTDDDDADNTPATNRRDITGGMTPGTTG